MSGAKNAPYFYRGHPVVDYLFSPTSRAAQNSADRERNDKPIEPIRGFMSSDPTYLRFLDQLSRRLTDALPENVDESGRLYGNGIRSNHYGLRHMAGIPMAHGTWPLADNSFRREQEGLSNVWVYPWHRTLFRAFVHNIFSELEAVPLRLRKGSSTVIPEFTTDPNERMTLALEALGNAEEAGKMMLANDYQTPFLRFGIGGAYYVVYRMQNSDKVTFEKGVWTSKDRMVAPFEYAISSGREGQLFVSSKKLALPAPDGFFACRLRTAMGCPFGISASLMPVYQATRAGMYKKFSFSYHHTTRLQKQERLRQWGHCIFTDVKDHDMLWPQKLYLPEIEDKLLSMGWADWGVKLLITSLKLPIYVASPAVDEGKTLIGDWRQPDMCVGLSSGNPGTDVLGSLGMSFIYCLMQIEHTARHYITECQTEARANAFVKRWLEGDLEIGAMSKSDDAANLWKGVAGIEAAKVLQKKLDDKVQCSPYMHLEIEHGGAFLGDVAIYDQSKELKSVIMTGNMLSDVLNAFAPEYSVSSDVRDRTKLKRPFPGLSWATRASVYGSAPAYQQSTEIVERTFRDTTGESYTAYRDQWYKDEIRALSAHMASVAAYRGIDHYSQAEQDVLIDSTKLQYKWGPEDVSEEVLALSEFKIDVSVVRPYLQKFTNQLEV